MLTVYHVGVDTNNFQSFETDDMGFLETTLPLFHSGEPLGKKWKPPEVYIYKPKRKPGAFVGFCGGRLFAVVSEARPLIENFVQQSCEPLEFEYKGRSFTLLNCVNCIEALDEKKSVGSLSWPAEHVFISTRLQFSLFGIPQNNYMYCVEGLDAKDDEFKGTVDRHGLQGLCFQEVWSEKARRSLKGKPKEEV